MREGGGIYNKGSLSINASTISGNQVLNGPGGGIYSFALPVEITNSTIEGNTAASDGGGFWGVVRAVDQHVFRQHQRERLWWRLAAVFYHSTFVNSTVSGNSSHLAGGGIYAGPPEVFGADAWTKLYHVTVTLNQSASDGSGVYNSSPDLFASTDSIIAANESDDCGGPITSQGMSILYAVNPAHCAVTGSYVLADPKLSDLRFNGGPTKTHALLPRQPRPRRWRHLRLRGRQ